jgi:hypothetical protein
MRFRVDFQLVLDDAPARVQVDCDQNHVTLIVLGCAQYASEAEMAFPPYAALERDGNPHVEYTDNGEVVMFPLRVWPCCPSPVCFCIFVCRSIPRHGRVLLPGDDYLLLLRQITLNPKLNTVEEMQQRRKEIHMATIQVARRDLSFLAKTRDADFKV